NCAPDGRWWPAGCGFLPLCVRGFEHNTVGRALRAVIRSYWCWSVGIALGLVASPADAQGTDTASPSGETTSPARGETTLAVDLELTETSLTRAAIFQALQSE